MAMSTHSGQKSYPSATHQPLSIPSSRSTNRPSSRQYAHIVVVFEVILGDMLSAPHFHNSSIPRRMQILDPRILVSLTFHWVVTLL